MNKFNILVASLLVFAVVAQYAMAQNPKVLENEIDDAQEIDDELEGGFATKALKAVGLSSVNEWGYDMLDRNKGVKDLVAKRAPECKSATTKEACQTCCSANAKSASFNLFARFSSAGACTCFERTNNYAPELP